MELETWVSTHKNAAAIEKLRTAISDEQNPAYERIRSYISDWKQNNSASDFAVWFAVADNWCGRMIGLSLLDLCDASFRDYYESGQSPKSTAIEVIKSDDLYSGFFDIGED